MAESADRPTAPSRLIAARSPGVDGVDARARRAMTLTAANDNAPPLGATIARGLGLCVVLAALAFLGALVWYLAG